MLIKFTFIFVLVSFSLSIYNISVSLIMLYHRKITNNLTKTKGPSKAEGSNVNQCYKVYIKVIRIWCTRIVLITVVVFGILFLKYQQNTEEEIKPDQKGRVNIK